MSNSDDEDAFLYSSEDEQPALKKARYQSQTDQAEPSQNPGSNAPSASKSNEASSGDGKGQYESELDDEDDDEDDEDESSDDDVEFVIGDTAPRAPTNAPTTVSASAGALNDTIGEVNDDDDDTDDKQNGQDAIGSKKKNVEVSKDDGGATVDINAVAEYEGKPLTQLDLDELKEKPWRAPGADISDYFNYGFDELTWTAYCHKQG
ncbi:hypothetical protein JCM33374_g1714 [Metschnikowia sp. JCM 33374]|nr:hypothetical protein JCM33374_g1714 [Metschnikowia sp. JCM 33374]